MKRALLLMAAALCLVLAGCGGSSGLNKLEVHSVEMKDDKVVAEVSFDQEYKGIMLEFHSDINKDKFE